MTPRLHNCNSTRRMGAAAGWGEASRRAASQKKQLEGNVEMTKKLAMTVGTARRAVRILALLAAVAVAIGARAERETVGGYMWTSQINVDAF